MITIKYINKLEDLFEIISEQKYDASKDRHRSSFLYRGLTNDKFSLVTSLKRNCGDKQIELEESILRNFAKYAESEEPTIKESIWRQMILGQHHGLPTRLMDWTYSPLVALHFACTCDNMSEMNNNNSCVWKIDIEELNSLLPSNYQDMLNQKRAYLFTVDMLEQLTNNLNTYDCAMGANALVLVEPPSIDQRIINQYSYFSIIPMDMTSVEDFLNTHTSGCCKYIINKDLKWRIRDMLDQMNINERIMYPGLDGLSTWLKRHYYVK